MKLFLTGSPNYDYCSGQDLVLNKSNYWVSKFWPELRHDFELVNNLDEADAILTLQYFEYLSKYKSQIDEYEIKSVNDRRGSRPHFFYLWDCYSWSNLYKVDGTRGSVFQWKDLCEVLGQCNVMVPNTGTKKTLKSMFGIDSYIVTPGTCTFYKRPIRPLSKYVGIAHRRYHRDLTDHWAEQACKELRIPYFSTREYPDQYESGKHYKDMLSHASLILSTKTEASTGGMSLIEGYSFGSQVMVPNSPMNGASEIFGSRAIQYHHSDYNDLKEKLRKWYLGGYERHYDSLFVVNHSVGAFSTRLSMAIKGL